MATIKAYTDLSQSKILAKILPLESADYYHAPDVGIVITTPYITYCGEERCVPAYKGATPCWSLAALLNILPSGKVLMHDKESYKYKCICKNIDTSFYDNPVDACYEMIIKLHKLNLL